MLVRTVSMSPCQGIYAAAGACMLPQLHIFPDTKTGIQYAQAYMDVEMDTEGSMSRSGGDPGRFVPRATFCGAVLLGEV